MATTVGGFLAHPTAERNARPSFLGTMRGEWLKLSRMWIFWIMLGLMVVGYALFALILGAGGNPADQIKNAPLRTLYVFMSGTLFLLRVFWGMMIIVLTARLIGMEYSGGTIRVLLARGVGRLQLLLAKLSVIALVSVIGAALLVLWATLCDAIMLAITVHNFDLLKAANATYWSDARLYAASVLISLGVSILMAAAVTTVVRSLAAGLSISVAYFPVDNFSILILTLGSLLTHWDFWTLVSGDFLGLNLNTMGEHLVSGQARVINSPFVPLTPVTSGHILLVTAIYAAIFIVVSVVMTAVPDVKE